MLFKLAWRLDMWLTGSHKEGRDAIEEVQGGHVGGKVLSINESILRKSYRPLK